MVFRTVSGDWLGRRVGPSGGDGFGHGAPSGILPTEADSRDTWSRYLQAGFTLIELLIVLSIVALLVTIVTPRYFASMDRAKEVALKEDLKVMRTSIDRFHADKGRYPESLDELVTQRYLREIPVDPISEASSTWVSVPSPENDEDGVADIRSGAPGEAADGSRYAEW